MNVIKLDKKTESDNLTIKGLKKYKGRNAEIIILINGLRIFLKTFMVL